METQTNGKVPASTALDLIDTTQAVAEESTKPAPKTPSPDKPKRKHGGNNKGLAVALDIDAGAKRVKCRLNGEFKSFNAEAKEIKQDVPLRTAGCFGYRKKFYIVGNATDRANGEVIQSSKNNKLTHLDIWILGAITHYRNFLKSAVDSRRRKLQPVQLILTLRVVTLSSPQRKELDKMLKAIEAFTWEDAEFNIKVKSVEFIDEGEGAAIEITRLHNLKRFGLLDLGGGTLTFTSYEWDGSHLDTTAKTAISGGGMWGLQNRIFKAITRTDRGMLLIEDSAIQVALEGSKVTDNGWNIPLRSNGTFFDISNEVKGALSEWVNGNYQISQLFDLISQKLAQGEYVYCTGGGFAIPTIAQWICEYLSKDIPGSKISVLENPQDVNLNGLRWLDIPNSDH